MPFSLVFKIRKKPYHHIRHSEQIKECKHRRIRRHYPYQTELLFAQYFRQQHYHGKIAQHNTQIINNGIANAFSFYYAQFLNVNGQGINQ